MDSVLNLRVKIKGMLASLSLITYYLYIKIVPHILIINLIMHIKYMRASCV